jgi:hypothetical protein
MEGFVHNNPWVGQSPRRVNQIHVRATVTIKARTDQRYRDLVQRWAAANDGPFPTMDVAEQQVRREYEVLCRALGRWAAVNPDEVFPPVVAPPAPHDEWEW